MKLSIEQIYDVACSAGFSPDQATTWTAIALAESGGETGALNDQGQHSVGLWQINVSHGVRANTWGNLNDPLVNARAAYDVSNKGLDMRPWTVTHASNQGTARDYRTYLDDVSAVTGYSGDPRGVEGYGAPLPPPLPPSGPDSPMTATTASYDQIDLGADPAAQIDTDGDGLTDAFERLVGSSLDVADTDHHGLSDARDLVVSGTDPLLADTDGDGLSDSTEAALGTSGTTWDTDSDGASDGAEAQHGTDPLYAENGTVPEAVAMSPAGTSTPGAPAIASETMPMMANPMTTGSMAAHPAMSTEAMSTQTEAPSTLADQFVSVAQSQKGDAYALGAEASLDDPDPDAFDCSELTQWAAHQVGVTIPDGSMYQYLELKNEGQLMPVEQALQTKGALLFYFSSEPTPSGGRPSSAHVAISLGDGRTIEAKGTGYGVNEAPPEGRFNYAGVIPEMGGAPTSGLAAMTTTAAVPMAIDSDRDGLSDAFEQMVGLDPFSPDSDGDGIDDATEQLGIGSVVSRPDPLSKEEVAAALAQQGLDAMGDEDADGVSNRSGVKHGLDPTLADSNGDGLEDSTEVMLGTSGTHIDSDGDGPSDFLEVELGSDPLVTGTPRDRWGLAGEEPADQTAADDLVQAMDADGDLG